MFTLNKSQNEFVLGEINQMTSRFIWFQWAWEKAPLHVPSTHFPWLDTLLQDTESHLLQPPAALSPGASEALLAKRLPDPLARLLARSLACVVLLLSQPAPAVCPPLLSVSNLHLPDVLLPKRQGVLLAIELAHDGCTLQANDCSSLCSLGGCKGSFSPS